MRAFSSVRGEVGEGNGTFIVPSTVPGAVHIISVFISQKTHTYVSFIPFTVEKIQNSKIFKNSSELRRVVK